MAILYSNLGRSIAPKKAKNNNLNWGQRPLAYMALAVLAIAASAYVFTREIHAQSVYSVCQEARIQNTINEGTCADMQAKYKFEYICEVANNSPSNHCYVEKNEALSYDD